MTQKRGKLLCTGITGKYDDTLKGQVFRFAGIVAYLSLGVGIAKMLTEDYSDVWKKPTG